MTRKNTIDSSHVDALFSDPNFSAIANKKEQNEDTPGLRQRINNMIHGVRNAISMPSKSNHRSSYRRNNGLSFEQLEPKMLAAGDLSVAAEIGSYDSGQDIQVIADAFINQLTEQEKAQLSGDLQTLNEELGRLQEGQIAAQNSLYAWQSDTTYGRSAYDATDKLSFISPSVRPSYEARIGDHYRLVNGFLAETQRILSFEAQGRWTDASNVQNNLQKTIDWHHVDTKYHRNEFLLGRDLIRLGMILPRTVSDCRNDLIRQTNRGAHLQETLTLLDTQIQDNDNRRSMIENSVAQGAYDLSRHSDSLDGKTPEELAAWDLAIQEWVEETTGQSMEIDLTATTVTPRVTRSAGALAGFMTSAESQTWMQEIADSVAANGRDIAKIRSDVIAALMRSPLKDILNDTDALVRQISIETLASDISAILADPEFAAETPITPALKIAKIQGPNILLTVASPHDESVVAFEGEGLFAMQNLKHGGGTAMNVGRLTFNSIHETGDYPLHLYDRTGGQILDTVMLHWDQPSKTLSIIDVSDGYGEGFVGPLTQEQYELLDKINNLETAFLDNAQINWIQQIRLYQITDSLPAPYDFYVDGGAELMEKIFASHPEYRPENWTAEIQQRQQSRQDVQPGVVEQWFHEERLMYENEMRNALGSYEKAMSEMMQEAVNILLQIRTGGNQRLLVEEKLMPLLERWNNPQYRNDWQQYSLPIDKIEGIGIRLPDSGRIMLAAVQVFERAWEEMCQRNADIESIRASQEYWREQGLRMDAVGGWVAVGGDENAIPEEMSRREISLAAKVSSIMKQSTDPRIIAHRNTLSLDITSQLTQDATPEMVKSVTYVAMNYLDYKLGNADSIVGKIDTPLGLQEVKVGMFPNQESIREFKFDEPTMVNIWIDTGLLDYIDADRMPTQPNLSITLTNEKGTVSYTSNKKFTLAGESISAVVPAGTYRITVRDLTDYSRLKAGEKSSITLSDIPVHMNNQKYKTQKIEGRISIENSLKTMPVTMTVGEFINGQRNWDINNLPKLDTAKPIWVVIHGRTDSDTFDQISELAKSLQTEETQVVTVNWHDAASDNTPSTAGLQGSKWIERTGKWIADQLMYMGFGKENINIVAHSWGTFVGYEVAKYLPMGVNTSVALDPAQDSDLLGSHYSEDLVNFAKRSSMSYAFHSSLFGKRSLALTADSTFQVNAPESYNSTLDRVARAEFLRGRYLNALGLEIIDEFQDAGYEHGFAVTLFTQLLKEGTINPISSLFTPARLSTSSPSLKERSDHYEGEFMVYPTSSTFTQGISAGKRWWKAQQYSFYGKDALGNDISKE